jgi:hypothetical protein
MGHFVPLLMMRHHRPGLACRRNPIYTRDWAASNPLDHGDKQGCVWMFRLNSARARPCKSTSAGCVWAGLLCHQYVTRAMCSLGGHLFRADDTLSTDRMD